MDVRLLNVPRHTGIARYTANLARELHRLAPSSMVFIGDPPPGILPPEADVLSLDLPMDNGLAGQKLLSLAARSAGADLLFCPYFMPPARFPGAVVMTVADTIPLINPEWFASPELGRFFREELPGFVRAADGVIAVSRATAADVVDLLGAGAGRVRTIYDGVDPVFTSGRACGSGFAFTGGRPYLLTVATLEPRKNIARVIAAYDILRKSGRAGEPLLVLAGGRGWKYGDVFEAAGKSPFSADIIFTGFVEDRTLAALYSDAAAFVYPSLYEGFGLPVVEAFASGAPVVTAANSSLPEVAGDAALYADPLDPSSIAGELEKILTDPALASGMRERGFKRAAGFSWERAARETLGFFAEVLAGKAGG